MKAPVHVASTVATPKRSETSANTNNPPKPQVNVVTKDASSTSSASPRPSMLTSTSNQRPFSVSGSNGNILNQQVARLGAAVTNLEATSTANPRSDGSAPRSVPSSKGHILLTTIRDLNFGTAVIGSHGGTITTRPDGSAFCTGSVILKPCTETSSAQLRFSTTANDQGARENAVGANDNNQGLSAQGDKGVTLSFVFPNQILLRRAGGSETLMVDGFNYVMDGCTINVGATLHLSSNYVPGSYLGDYIITTIRE